MLTALVLADGSVEALAATLGPLVGAVAQGLVADAVVIVRQPRADIAAVAEAVGAGYVVAARNPWAEGAVLARRDWLLCLDAGDVPAEPWIGPVERFLAGAGELRLAAFARPVGLRALASRFKQAAIGLDRPASGIILHRDLVAALHFARRIKPVRLKARLERNPGLA